MSLLISVKEAEFTFLKEKTNAGGNLSVQIQKLKEAGYIDVIKQFKKLPADYLQDRLRESGL
jgi:hypothetical protein